MAYIDINPSSLGAIFGVLIGPEMDHPSLGRSYLLEVPSFDMSCALIFLMGFYGIDFMADIDINPLSMGPIFWV